MKQLLQEIREAFHLSQERFAGLLGTTFATVNRWENGRTIPGKKTQDKIMKLCLEYGVPLHELVMENIQKESSIPLEPDRILLYHGSKSSLSGAIAPISRDKCDFGRGFYMGTDPVQPLTLVCDFEQSKFYVVSIDLSGLSVLEIPPNLEWAMLVAFYRGKMEPIKGTPLYQQYAQLAQGHDVLVGAIANDRMFYVLDNFFLGNITDVALIQSLAALQLGRQYVAVTGRACEKVRVEKEIPLSHLERLCLQSVSEQNRAKGISLANDICRNHRMVKVFASIGLALRELPLLTVEAVNQKQVRLSSGGIYQIVCIPAPLREELEEYIQRTGISGGPVFVTKNGKQISRASVTRTIRSLARDARVVPEKCNPRCLRKLYQTTMAEIEASVRLLMEQTYEQLLKEEQ